MCLGRAVNSVDYGGFDVAGARRAGDQIHRRVPVAAVEIDMFEKEQLIQRWQHLPAFDDGDVDRWRQ